ncbi:MAG: 5-(carboxyamino)imidazole ribonucleotide mutase [Solirubrobacterales bacterium]|nr:5-(carboxyamino)imidazole ribonucleotide mutase [Solirubrobacterales bacterium]MBV9473150.1 5-(carboxyamino)imidazole ribonucleotide mutase [Solirubrobacterales bacterium]MBV9838201.1 5-(carboxyamino)imidazole ribonucleotide mutase [Solirubrobacterales bacterium]
MSEQPQIVAVPASEPATEFEELDVDAPLVGIVMGSKSDLPAMEPAVKELTDRGIRSEVRVMSAHREPDKVADYARNAKLRGLRVIIAGAGLAAALPGVVAAHCELPVIGVPLTSRTSVAGGLDALLAIAQMPPGVPVACVGVDNARNAAVLAARILGA